MEAQLNRLRTTDSRVKVKIREVRAFQSRLTGVASPASSSLATDNSGTSHHSSSTLSRSLPLDSSPFLRSGQSGFPTPTAGQSRTLNDSTLAPFAVSKDSWLPVVTHGLRLKTIAQLPEKTRLDQEVEEWREREKQQKIEDRKKRISERIAVEQEVLKLREEQKRQLEQARAEEKHVIDTFVSDASEAARKERQIQYERKMQEKALRDEEVHEKLTLKLLEQTQEQQKQREVRKMNDQLVRKYESDDVQRAHARRLNELELRQRELTEAERSNNASLSRLDKDNQVERLVLAISQSSDAKRAHQKRVRLVTEGERLRNEWSEQQRVKRAHEMADRAVPDFDVARLPKDHPLAVLTPVGRKGKFVNSGVS
eukprot:TRINITY_DN3581_c0_g1_i1.p1 TRINITY_DN3581_c0_g1~~TRINITY_DN3581_c0_g1_i1.p1  ORF type:complete len:387 (+),score=70.85 TRINITY_DN3581_c0_g1_i1:57-1163(+)